jgi:ATP-dependent Lon protease
MYSANARQAIDPYTAFTGNINLVGSQYRSLLLKLKAKLDAALLFGCRRVFVPKENRREVSTRVQYKIEDYLFTDIVLMSF